MKDEIVRLENLIKVIENELHDCCLEVLEIGDLADKVFKRYNHGQHISIAVHDACEDIYHKYDYRVRGYDAENIILDEIDEQ